MGVAVKTSEAEDEGPKQKQTQTQTQTQTETCPASHVALYVDLLDLHAVNLYLFEVFFFYFLSKKRKKGKRVSLCCSARKKCSCTRAFWWEMGCEGCDLGCCKGPGCIISP